MISSDKAIRILSEWRASSSLIRLFGGDTGSAVTVAQPGATLWRVSDIFDEPLAVSLCSDAGQKLTIPLNGAEFEYKGTCETGSPEFVAEIYVCFLEARVQGNRFYFAEVRRGDLNYSATRLEATETAPAKSSN
jgi:hypothetical protein